MPLVRHQIRHWDQYVQDDVPLQHMQDFTIECKKDPGHVMEAMSMRHMTGLLKQMQDLAVYSANLFEDLMTETNRMGSKLEDLCGKIKDLESVVDEKQERMNECPQQFLEPSIINEAFKQQESIARLKVQSNLFTKDTRNGVQHAYERCRAAPPLQVFDQHSKTGPCMNRFSDPDLFLRELAKQDGGKLEQKYHSGSQKQGRSGTKPPLIPFARHGSKKFAAALKRTSSARKAGSGKSFSSKSGKNMLMKRISSGSHSSSSSSLGLCPEDEETKIGAPAVHVTHVQHVAHEADIDNDAQEEEEEVVVEAEEEAEKIVAGHENQQRQEPVQDNPQYVRFRQMLKIGLSRDAVAHAMIQAGFDPNDLGLGHEEDTVKPKSFLDEIKQQTAKEDLQQMAPKSFLDEIKQQPQPKPTSFLDEIKQVKGQNPPPVPSKPTSTPPRPPPSKPSSNGGGDFLSQIRKASFRTLKQEEEVQEEGNSFLSQIKNAKASFKLDKPATQPTSQPMPNPLLEAIRNGTSLRKTQQI